MRRDVSSRLVLSITAPAELVFAVAVSDAHALESESITAMLDGQPVEVEEFPDVHGGRLHRVRSDPGQLVFAYAATVLDRAPMPTTSATDLLTYLRPSRYAESDWLAPTAAAELGGIDSPSDLLAAVTTWVGTQLAYEAGSSLPTDGAVQTLLARKGVCRDFAHVCVALLRARNVPARVVAAYAPGLTPMDFHAVAEAWIDGTWQTIDATMLAPRSTLVRIATGRDAADTAFLTVISGLANLIWTEVTAVADTLPDDDGTLLVSIG